MRWRWDELIHGERWQCQVGHELSGHVWYWGSGRLAVMRYNIRARVRHHEGNGRVTEYTFGKLRKERGVTWHDDGSGCADRCLGWRAICEVFVWQSRGFCKLKTETNDPAMKKKVQLVRGLPNWSGTSEAIRALTGLHGKEWSVNLMTD